MKKMIIISLTFSVSLLSVLLYFFYTKNRNIIFEEFEEYSVNSTEIESNIWFTLRDEKFNGFYSTEKLKQYGIETDNISFDFEHYTYVITIGHKLKDIKYSYSLTKNRKLLIFPKQFIGRVTLDKDSENKIFIYKIKRMDIDCDYHDPKSYVSFD